MESSRKYESTTTTTFLLPHHCQYGREAARVKALRPLRGAQGAALTQAFLLGNFSAMWGMGKCASQILTVRGYDRCLAQYHDLRFFRRRAPVRELNAALRCESHGCRRNQTRGSSAVLCPSRAHAVAF